MGLIKNKIITALNALKKLMHGSIQNEKLQHHSIVHYVTAR